MILIQKAFLLDKLNYNKKFLNEQVNVLIEEVKDKKSIGHTENYLKVIINEPLLENKCYDVLITDVKVESVTGRLIEK